MQIATGIPSQGRAIIAGGLAGAGKSTVLEKYAGISRRDYLTINPDDIKEMMASHGHVPKVKGLDPMEATPLVHEEASHIANLIAQAAYARKKNVVWDITMSSEGSVKRRLTEMEKAGYHDIRAVFVQIPVEESINRVRARHRRGMEAYRQGKGQGGRFVSSGVIRTMATASGTTHNRETFDALRKKFTGWSLYDNSGSKPKLVEQHMPPQQHHVISAEEIIRQVMHKGKDWVMGGKK